MSHEPVDTLTALEIIALAKSYNIRVVPSDWNSVMRTVIEATRRNREDIEAIISALNGVGAHFDDVRDIVSPDVMKDLNQKLRPLKDLKTSVKQIIPKSPD